MKLVSKIVICFLAFVCLILSVSLLRVNRNVNSERKRLIKASKERIEISNQIIKNLNEENKRKDDSLLMFELKILERDSTIAILRKAKAQNEKNKNEKIKAIDNANSIDLIKIFDGFNFE